MPIKQSNIIGLDRPVMGQICLFPMVGKDNICEEWRSKMDDKIKEN
jgi:hypothetical protein